jgi:sphinganine-1-phosphate aldolase
MIMHCKTKLLNCKTNLLNCFSGVADKFISDVRDITAKCLADPESCDKGSAAIYGMAQSIPDRSVVDKITW